MTARAARPSAMATAAFLAEVIRTITSDVVHASTDYSRMKLRRIVRIAPIAVFVSAAPVLAQRVAPYFPPKGEWKTARPAEVGMDSAKLQAAVDFALASA